MNDALCSDWIGWLLALHDKDDILSSAAQEEGYASVATSEPMHYPVTVADLGSSGGVGSGVGGAAASDGLPSPSQSADL